MGIGIEGMGQDFTGSNLSRIGDIRHIELDAVDEFELEIAKLEEEEIKQEQLKLSEKNRIIAGLNSAREALKELAPTMPGLDGNKHNIIADYIVHELKILDPEEISRHIQKTLRMDSSKRQPIDKLYRIAGGYK